MVRKIISGGQTGVDKTALILARQLGLETGGWAPKGWRTEDGPDLTLGTIYKLQEHHSAHFRPRTRANVRDSDVTVWFGTVNTPGFVCTRDAAQKYGKRMWCNPTPEFFAEEICANHDVVNVAGNRLSTFPLARDIAHRAFETLGTFLAHHRAKKDYPITACGYRFASGHLKWFQE